MYKKVINGRKELCDEYCRLRTELTQDKKCIGRLLMVEKNCTMNTVDYVKR